MTDNHPARHASAQLTTARLPLNATLVASPHHLASSAAIEIMDAGGSAVDGAIAANAMLGVVLPDTCGIGGDLFALVHRPGEVRPAVLNASGRAGSGTTAHDLRRSGLNAIPHRSPLTITVPGCVDGWHALHRRFGRLPLDRIVEPAVVAATDGFPASPELTATLARIHGLVRDQPSAASLYPRGEPPSSGDMLRRPELAVVLRSLAEQGRDAFYLGDVGTGITTATGGTVTSADLERDQAEWTEPLGLEVFGRTAWTVPPNSQGYLVLAAAWILEHVERTAKSQTAELLHASIEAYRAVAWERDDLVSDPDTMPLQPDVLVDPARLTERAGTIDPTRTTSRPQWSAAPGGTAYLCTRDAGGMGVSLIQSNFSGIGSGLSAGATGVFLHNRGAGFNLVPGHPNEYAAGRRPLHTLSPTLWTRANDLSLLLGTRGGNYQPQFLLQAAANHLMEGDPPEVALRRPRWRVDGGTLPTVSVESRVLPSTIDGLQELGHNTLLVEPWQEGWGPVSMISIDTTTVQAAADPRVSTTAALSGRERPSAENP